MVDLHARGWRIERIETTGPRGGKRVEWQVTHAGYVQGSYDTRKAAEAHLDRVEARLEKRAAAKAAPALSAPVEPQDGASAPVEPVSYRCDRAGNWHGAVPPQGVWGAMVSDGDGFRFITETAPVPSAPVETAPAPSAPVETAPAPSAPVSTELRNSYLYHRKSAHYLLTADRALKMARFDVTNGTRRHPDSICSGICRQPNNPHLAFIPYNAGLRFVGAVNTDDNRRHNRVWNTTGRKYGYVSDPYGEYSSSSGEGLMWGVVLQLPGRKGAARFLAGYAVSYSGDEGATVDLSTVYSVDVREGDIADAQDAAAEANAPAAADSMADHAADKERHYQIASAAGGRYTENLDNESTIRQQLLDILKERRATTLSKTMREIVRDKVERLLDQLHQSRKDRALLVSGEYYSLWFNTRNADAIDAFNDGAGEKVL
jgi:hypothetical protein